MTQRQAQKQVVNVILTGTKGKKKKRTVRSRRAPVRQHIMPPPVIQVVQERWFQPQQGPTQQFHYQPPVLPPRDTNTAWNSINAPVESPLNQVVGDLMQQGIEPTELRGLTARELASIRDALTSEKVSVDTQTGPQPWEAPLKPVKSSRSNQTAPESANIETQTQRIPRRLPTFSDASSIFNVDPTPAPKKTLSLTDTISVLDVPPKAYTDMSIEELKVAVQYKGVKSAQNLSKAQLMQVLQSDNPSTTAAVLLRKKKAPILASPADSAFEGMATGSK